LLAYELQIDELEQRLECAHPPWGPKNSALH
jgi:hypothetical protein